METNDSPDIPSFAATPVICEKCRATGMAGDAAFADIPDLLAFEPVPRRPHANGWTPEHQRAFIAALAITGSARQAARQVGRASFGAEQMRTAKGGRSFAAAWDAAIEIARDRELSRLHENLGELAARTEEANASAKANDRLVPPGDDDDREESSIEREAADARERILERLQRLRKQELLRVRDDPKLRNAWDLLNGPENWKALDDGTWDDLTEEERNPPRDKTDLASPVGVDGTSHANTPASSSAPESHPRVRLL